jgi:hypothetical protein
MGSTFCEVKRGEDSWSAAPREDKRIEGCTALDAVEGLLLRLRGHQGSGYVPQPAASAGFSSRTVPRARIA